MHLLHFGTYENILYPYVKSLMKSDGAIYDETDFVFLLLTAADLDAEIETDQTLKPGLAAEASRYKKGRRAIPEYIVKSFRRDETRDSVIQTMKYICSFLERGRKQQLVKEFCGIVQMDTTIDDDFKTNLLSEAGQNDLVGFLTDLLIYAVGIDPTEQGKEYPANNYNIPMYNDWFTDRTAELKMIEENFKDSHIQILYGMGGMGKTQTALQYVYDHYRSYSLIHWVNADSIESTVKCYRDFLTEKKLSDGNLTDDQVCRLYTNYMESHSDWLIVYDNCFYYTDGEFQKFNRLYLPKNRESGYVLITTRNNQPIGRAKRIEIGPLAQNDAVSFLLQRTETEDEIVAGELAMRLGRFPLALELAGAYICATPGCGIPDYLEYLSEGTDILDENVGIKDYTHTVREVLQLTFEHIVTDYEKEEFSQYIEEIVRLCSFGAPYDIELRVLGLMQSERDFMFEGDQLIYKDENPEITRIREYHNLIADCCKDRRKLNAIKQILVKYALMREQKNGLLSMHELEQEIMRNHTENMDYYCKQLITAYNIYTLKFDNSYTAMARDELHSLRIFEHQKTYHEKYPASNADHTIDALQLCKMRVVQAVAEYCALWENENAESELKDVLKGINLAYTKLRNTYLNIDQRERSPIHLAWYLGVGEYCLGMYFNEASWVPFLGEMAIDMLLMIYEECRIYDEETLLGFKCIIGLPNFLNKLPLCLSVKLHREYDKSIIPAIRYMSFLLELYGDEVKKYYENSALLFNRVATAYINNDPTLLPEKIKEWLAHIQ